MSEQKRSARFEIILLFRFMRPAEITRLGYSKATVYKYYERYKKARVKAMELLKQKGIHVPENLI